MFGLFTAVVFSAWCFISLDSVFVPVRFLMFIMRARFVSSAVRRSGGRLDGSRIGQGHRRQRLARLDIAVLVIRVIAFIVGMFTIVRVLVMLMMVALMMFRIGVMMFGVAGVIAFAVQVFRVFLAFLAVHVLAGLTAVVTGAVAAPVRKGSPRHIRAGRWYYLAITVVFVTATVLAALRWRQDYYLFIIGAVAFTAATIGYQHRRRHRPRDTGHIAGMGVAYVAMLTAFYVDNGPHLPLWDRLPVLAFWLLPTAVAAPIITRAIIRAKNKARLSGPETSTAAGSS